MEEPTEIFSSSCVKEWKGNLTNENHNPERKGKIDIAVYSTNSKTGHYPHKPLFPIEIKNINPSKYSFLLDIERNLYYLNIQDKNTGCSVVELAYNVSIEEFNNIYTEDLDNKISEKKNKYVKWLNKSGLFSANISFEVFVQTLDCVSYSKEDRFDTSEGLTEADYTDDDYCRIGVIVEITKTKIL